MLSYHSKRKGRAMGHVNESLVVATAALADLLSNTAPDAMCAAKIKAVKTQIARLTAEKAAEDAKVQEAAKSKPAKQERYDKGSKPKRNS